MENLLGNLIFLKIPHNTLRQSSFCCTALSRDLHSDVVSWQHEFIYPFEVWWLIFLHPDQLRECKVWRVIEDLLINFMFFYLLVESFSDFRGPSITPNDAFSDGFELFINNNESMHLIAYSDSFQLSSIWLGWEQLLEACFHPFPPHLWILFSPIISYWFDLEFFLWVFGGLNDFLLSIDEGHFDEGTAQINAHKHCIILHHWNRYSKIYLYITSYIDIVPCTCIL